MALAALAVCAVILVPGAIDTIVSATARADALAATLTAGAVTAVLAGPVFGRAIDLTRRHLSPRAWAVFGALAGGGGIVVMLTSAHIAQTITGWVVAQAGYNAVFVVVAASVSTHVSAADRVRASATFTGIAFVSPLVPFALVAVLPDATAVVAIVLALAALAMTALISPEAGAADSTTPPRRRPHLPRPFWAIWAQRFLIQSALGLTTGFSLYLVTDRMAEAGGDPLRIVAVSALVGGIGVGIGAFAAGAVARGLGRSRIMLIVGALALAGAASLRAFAEMPVALWVASLAGGVGVGVFLSVNLALAMRYSRTAGHATVMGVLNAAESIPSILIPGVAGLLLRVGSGDLLSTSPNNYVVMLLSGAGIAVLAALTSLPVRARHAPRDDARAARRADSTSG